MASIIDQNRWHAPNDNFAIDHPADDENTLYVFCDLKSFPICFDIDFFLMSAEVARANQGLRHIILVIIPAQNNLRLDVPSEFAAEDLASNLSWRLNHICLPIISMFPSITGLIVARNRTEGHLRWATAKRQFPDRRALVNLPFTPIDEFYSPAFGHMAKNPGKYMYPRAMYEAVAAVTRQLAPRLGDRRLIVITLRQRCFSSKRNSNIGAWMKFAESLDPNLYLPIFVPDTETVLTADFGVWRGNCFFDAAFDLQLRMALYELAWLNLFVSSGPFSLATLNGRCRTLGFKFIIAGGDQDETAEGLKNRGFPRDEDPLYATPFQRWVWQDDDYPVIMREFDAMAKFIEASETSQQRDSACRDFR